MIALVSGSLSAKTLEKVEVMTAGGVGYEIVIPLGVYETLPKPGETVSLHTHLVVKEDGWQLFGFSSTFEREVFRRVLGAKGVGPSLAIGLISTLTADRLVRALRAHDVATLQSAPRVGRKKAEQLILDLADKLDDLEGVAGSDHRRPESPSGVGAAGADDAVRALVSLGYSAGEAERAVREVVEHERGTMAPANLIRAALGRLGSR